jgi:glycosyltransferase involved in cell wall biosynthesis
MAESLSHVSLTILVPLYNHAEYVAELIQSVNAYRGELDLQLIVIDDSSTDDSYAVAARSLASTKLDYMLLKNPQNLGVLSTLNRGLTHARGEFIIPCASDDLILADKLDERIRAMLAEPSALAQFARVQVIDSEGEPVEVAAEPYIERTYASATRSEFARRFIRNWCLIGPGYCFRKRMYQQFGEYDPTMKHEDWELFLRIVHEGEFIVSQQVVAKYRLHDRNLHDREPVRATLEQLAVTLRYFLRLDLRYSTALARRMLNLTIALLNYSILSPIFRLRG